jgi:WD40 repeat protein
MNADTPLLSERKCIRLREMWSVTLHEAPVALCWAPQLHALAVAPAEGEIVLLDAANGTIAKRWTGNDNGNFSLAWHPTAAHIAAGGGDGLVRVWSPSEASPLATLRAGTGWVERMQWSPGNPHTAARLAAGSGRDICVWGPDFALERTWRAHAAILDLEWNPLLALFITTHRTGLQMWIPEQDEEPHDIDYPGAVLSVRWSSCGRMFALGNHDATASIIDVETMKCLRLGGFAGKVAHLAWDPEGDGFAGTGGNVISVWDLNTKANNEQLALALRGHTSSIAALAWQPRGKILASGGSDARLLLWLPREEVLPISSHPLTAPVTQVAWSSDGRHLAVATRDGRVTLFTNDTP